MEQVLSEDARTKSCAILGRFPYLPGQAIILLGRTSFAPKQSLLSSLSCSEELFQNDAYSKYLGAISLPAYNVINIDVIYPATEKHISKHSAQAYILVQESPELYIKATVPFMQAIPASRLGWVANILEKKAEVERLIFEDAHKELGFMLHPDMKAQDQSQVQSLYCIALCCRTDLQSLRDLNASHLPLLRNLRDKCQQLNFILPRACGAQAVLARYSVASQELRMFLHYPPSYYHLHVHVAHVQLDGGAGMAAGKAHLLDDVIDNIALMSDYYARRTLTFSIGERDPLLNALLDAQSVSGTPKAETCAAAAVSTR